MNNKISVELSQEDLFLIEMALDQVVTMLPEDSPICIRYRKLDEMIFAVRKNPAASIPLSNGMEDKIEELDFSVRTYNILKRARIDTISQLVNCSEEELMKLRNMGKNSLKEIHDKLCEFKLK